MNLTNINIHFCPTLNKYWLYRPSNPSSGADGEGRSFKNIEDIVCYKCGEKGHFANRCTKGLLAFISLQQNQRQNPGEVPK